MPNGHSNFPANDGGQLPQARSDADMLINGNVDTPLQEPEYQTQTSNTDIYATSEEERWKKALPDPPHGTNLDGWTDVGHTTADPKPIIPGRMHNGEIRVDEADLEPGTYRVEFGGQIVGEVRVTDPVIARKSNRKERREGQRLHRHKLPPHALGGLQRRR